MDAEKNDVARIVQNLTAICGSMVTNGMIMEDEAPGASLNVRKAKKAIDPELKCWRVC